MKVKRPLTKWILLKEHFGDTILGWGGSSVEKLKKSRIVPKKAFYNFCTKKFFSEIFEKTLISSKGPKYSEISPLRIESWFFLQQIKKQTKDLSLKSFVQKTIPNNSEIFSGVYELSKIQIIVKKRFTKTSNTAVNCSIKHIFLKGTEFLHAKS